MRLALGPRRMSASMSVLEVPSVMSVSFTLEPDQNSPSEGKRMSVPLVRAGLLAASLASRPEPMLTP